MPGPSFVYYSPRSPPPPHGHRQDPSLSKPPPHVPSPWTPSPWTPFLDTKPLAEDEYAPPSIGSPPRHSRKNYAFLETPAPTTPSCRESLGTPSLYVSTPRTPFLRPKPLAEDEYAPPSIGSPPRHPRKKYAFPEAPAPTTPSYRESLGTPSLYVSTPRTPFMRTRPLAEDEYAPPYVGDRSLPCHPGMNTASLETPAVTIPFDQRSFGAQAGAGYYQSPPAIPGLQIHSLLQPRSGQIQFYLANPKFQPLYADGRHIPSYILDQDATSPPTDRLVINSGGDPCLKITIDLNEPTWGCKIPGFIPKVSVRHVLIAIHKEMQKFGGKERLNTPMSQKSHHRSSHRGSK
jgi:hypothetical protein